MRHRNLLRRIAPSLKPTKFVAGTVLGAVVLSGGLLTASAGSSSSGSSFVPIAPCRLMDTRPSGDNVGPRSTPLGSGETYTASVWGDNGNCSIPATATAVTMNVTFVNPSSSGYLTVFPSDANPRPSTSNLNWTAGQAPAPNAVTSRLSADGRLGFYNLAGSVDVIADIVGYYEPSGAGSVAGPKGDTGPAGPAGPAGAQGPAGISGYQIVWTYSTFDTTPEKTVFTTCPAGKHVIGGGSSIFPSLADPSRSAAPIVLKDDMPDIEGGGWFARATAVSSYGYPWDLSAYAICANVTP